MHINEDAEVIKVTLTCPRSKLGFISLEDGIIINVIMILRGHVYMLRQGSFRMEGDARVLRYKNDKRQSSELRGGAGFGMLCHTLSSNPLCVQVIYRRCSGSFQIDAHSV